MKWIKHRLSPIDLIVRDKKASWEWFLEYNNEETMIGSKSANQVWFKKWKKYFKSAKKTQKRKGKRKTIKIKKYEILRILSPKDRKLNDELNRAIVSLLITTLPDPDYKNIYLNRKALGLKALNPNDHLIRISEKLNISKTHLGQRLSKLEGKEIIKSRIENILIRNDYPYPIKYYIFTLDPFFEFCESVNTNLPKNEKIIFSKDEKRVLELLFDYDNSYMRSQVFLEYKNIDFLNAILKFYIKHFYIPYTDTKKKIKTKLSISKSSMDWIMNVDKKELDKEQYEIYSKNPTKKMYKFLEDLGKIKRWNTHTAINWKEFNTTDIDQDDFNFYGGIYHAFYNSDKDLMNDLGWKLIKIFALKNT